MKNETRSDYKRRFEEAIRLRDSNRLDEAAVALRALTSDRSDRPEAALVLAELQLRQGYFRESTKLFSELVEMYPASEKASLGLFHSLWGIGRREDAVAEMRRYRADYESMEYRRLLRELDAEGVSLPAK